jgi:ELWxxDGT repeat protein
MKRHRLPGSSEGSLRPRRGAPGRRRGIVRQRVGGPLAIERFEPKIALSVNPTFVADINQTPLASNPRDFLVAGSVAYFTAADPEHGRELWKTDGTTAGTAIVADLTPGPESSSISLLTALSDRVYFVVHDAGITNTSTLWTVDVGSDVPESLATDVPSAFGGDAVEVLGDELMFWRDEPGSTPTRALWKTDGTVAGTVAVRSFGEGGYQSGASFATAGGNAYFAVDDGVTGSELWKTDGTSGGTQLVKDIVAGGGGSFPQLLGVAGDTVLFSATDEFGDSELWRTDAVAGAVLVADLNPTGSSYPENVIAIGEMLFLTARESGFESRVLWRIDGFRSAVPVATSFPLVSPGGLTLVGDQVYFSANDGLIGSELWRIGVEGAPQLVREIFTPFAPVPFANDPSIPAITAESEPNDSVAEANDLRGSFTESGGVFRAEVTVVDDGLGTSGDWFRIFLPEGYQLAVDGMPWVAALHGADGGLFRADRAVVLRTRVHGQLRGRRRSPRRVSLRLHERR